MKIFKDFCLKYFFNTHIKEIQYNGFFPATHGSHLAKEIEGVVDTNMKRLDMKCKVVQTRGVSLARQLAKTDLSGCLIPDCYFCQA